MPNTKKVKDIRWLAGLLEGEGSFCWCRHAKGTKKNPRYPVVQISSTDKDVIQEAARLLGTSVMGPYSYTRRIKKHYKPVWVTRRQGKKAIVLARKLYPYMCKRRRAQIKEICND